MDSQSFPGSSEPPVQAEVISSNVRLFNCITLSKFLYEWTIEDEEVFHLSVENESPVFSTFVGRHKLLWSLKYFYERDYIDLATLTLLNCEPCGDIEIFARLYTIILDESPRQLIMAETLAVAEPLPTSRQSPVKRNQPQPASTICLRLELDIMLKDPARIDRLSSDMEALLRTGRASDVVFLLADRSVKAHKAILTARNRKFARLLRVDGPQKTRERIEIRDMDGEVFEKLLHYLYTGVEPSAADERLADLLIAADEYEVEDLKGLCGESLISGLTADNASDALVSADLVNSEELRARIMAFIFAKKDEVINTNGYSNMVKFHIHLVEEMFRRIKLK